MLSIPSFETLADYVNRGLLTEVTQGDLSIFNYSKRASRDGAWDPVTLMCRGLVLNRVTGEVVALPFSKFFNYGEDTEAVLPSMTPDVTTIKYDGALGILFRMGDGSISWTTRGSFYSPHAESANRVWKQRYSHVQIPVEFTVLAEIITPEAQICIPYDFEDLVVLGIRNRFTGEDLPYDQVVAYAQSWGMPVTESVTGSIPDLVARAIQMPETEEGFVLRFGDFRIKVKSQQYCLLARVMGRLTDRALADLWYAQDLSILDSLPLDRKEESLSRIASYEAEFQAFFTEKDTAIQQYRAKALSPREYAELLKGNPDFSILMGALRNKPLDFRHLWYKLRFNKSPRPLTVALDDDSE